VHLLLEELRIFLKSSLSTQSVCHKIRSRVAVDLGVEVLNFLTLESESCKKYGVCMRDSDTSTDTETVTDTDID